ncbi:MAG: sugar MFS transporter [Steroidobacteraceae bacterium]
MNARTFRVAVGTVYTAGLLQGFAFVLIPALGDVLRSAPYSLSAGHYGALFLPETAGAIASALVAGRLARRRGAQGVFRLGLICNVAAALLLAASAAVAGAGAGSVLAGSAAAYAMLLIETALLGFGFGLNLSVTNHFAAALFPARDITAVTVLNAVIGGATAVSPLILQAIQAWWAWWGWPVAIGAAFLLLLALPRVAGDREATAHLRTPQSRDVRVARCADTGRLALFAAAVLMYAIVEGSFGSWASLYGGALHFPPRYGAWALAAFWGAMTLFRLLLGAAPRRRVSPRVLYVVSPLAIAVCFVGAARVTTPTALVLAFAAAGAACSIYYPFSMSFALRAFPDAQTKTAGVLVAALMAGEGVGSWFPGPLQQWFDLTDIYLVSALWGAPLLWLAWRLGRERGGPGA